MKFFLLFFIVLFPSVIFAQKFALIDKGWHRPIMYVDSVTDNQLQNGWYPVYKEDMDSLITLINNFKNLLHKGMKRTYINNDVYQTKNIKFDITNVQKAYGDRYDIVMISDIKTAVVKFRLSNSDYPNKYNEQRIKNFLGYLKKYHLLK